FALIVHTRKVNGIDIYSDRLMRELGDDALVLDMSYSGKGLAQGASNMACFNLLAVGWRTLAQVFMPFTGNDAALLTAIEERVKEKFNITLPLRAMATRKLHHFRFMQQVYKMLFRLRR